MKSRATLQVILTVSFLLAFSHTNLHAQEQGLVARWTFDQTSNAVARDVVGGVNDKVEGLYKYVPGVSGTGMRFDGYTTQVVRSVKKAPRFDGAFTLEAWVALNTLPWNWLPIIDDEMFNQVGYSFGIDPFGHLGLQVGVNGVWQSLYSTDQLPLKKWAHVAGTFDPTQGLAIYIDGKAAGHLAVTGTARPADRVDLLIGRTREAMLPLPGDAIHPFYPFFYSLDGILDEVKLYARCLTPAEVLTEFSQVHAPTGEVLPWPVLPSGPPGAGRFGAYYASLKFEDVWDRPRRIGPDSDVVVRFDQSPIRLVFWQGTNYVPAWVTENNKWYSDEFLETWGKGCPDGEDCEAMSDKQSVYSHVSILESTDARVVIHWRYALSEVEHNEGARPDPLTGWWDWADEYWTVYPDGTAVRKQVVHTTDFTQPLEWQETIIINGPGQKPEDNINLDALTLANMKGETHTYSWKPRVPLTFTQPDGPEKVTGPADANIQMVNLKSEWKPFQIAPPSKVTWDIYDVEKSYFTFPCWNHWPVAQIPSSGRPCVAPDRPSHTSLSHIYWQAYQTTDDSITKLLLDGLTTKPAAELVPLAQSWVSAPKIEVGGEGFRSDGYDPAQRAYVVTRDGANKSAVIDLTLQAGEGSPVVNPAIVIKNWGDGQAKVSVDGEPRAPGKALRLGLVPQLEGTDLILWLETQGTKPLHIRVTSEGK